jgi:hypothetical protein
MESSNIDSGTFETRQKEVTEQFYLDNIAGNRVFAKKLGAMSGRGELMQQSYDTDYNDRQETMIKLLVQQNQLLVHQNEEMLILMRKMNKDMTFLKERIKIMKDRHTDGAGGEHQKIQESEVQDCYTRDHSHQIVILNYKVIDQTLKNISRDLPRSIVYYMKEHAEISYERLSQNAKKNKNEKGSYKSAHSKRKKLFTPFIHYVTAHIGEFPPQTTPNVASATNLWNRKASTMLKDLLVSLKNHLVEKNLINASNDLTATGLIRSNVYKEMKAFIESQTIAANQQK